MGSYTLHEEINSGGMSEIWLGTDDTGSTYAIRLMRNNHMLAFTERKRFITGCEVLQQLPAHPSIIGYIEHGRFDGELALVLEYVEGSNLKLLLTEQNPVLIENMAQILIDTAEAMEHIHDHGFMHLDIKPENVVMTRNGSIRVLDFDLARPIPPTPRRLDKNPGTPLYMSPEQLMRKPVDQRADIWAFGVSAFELLTFKKPFPGETPDAVLRRQMDRSGFSTPREINPDLPAELERIVMKCLEKDMNQRYPITSLLVHDLRQALYVNT